MKMRLSAIAGAADAREHLASPYELSFFDPQASRLKMMVVGKLTVAQIDGDRVSGGCFGRNWYSGMKRLAVSGDVLGNTVF
jgi:hypothetical protein